MGKEKDTMEDSAQRKQNDGALLRDDLLQKWK